MGKSSEPKIYVSAGERTLHELEETISEFNNSSLGLEIRLDYLENTDELDKSLRELINRYRFPRVLATCRRTNAGGNFAGTVEEQLEVLGKAVRAGCQIVDLELESVKRKKPQELQRLFRPARLIVSYHNYRRSPPLHTLYRRLVRVRGSHYQDCNSCTKPSGQPENFSASTVPSPPTAAVDCVGHGTRGNPLADSGTPARLSSDVCLAEF